MFWISSAAERAFRIEVDGAAYEMGNRPNSDLKRDAWIMAQGVATLRLAARDVMADPEGIIGTIVAACRRRLIPSTMLRIVPCPFRGGKVIAGYSGTPLAAKLGLKPGQRVWRDRMPASVADEIGDTGAILVDAPETGLDVAHIFKTERAALADDLAALRRMLAPAGFVWVSWPKKASKVPTRTWTRMSSVTSACRWDWWT